MKGNKGKARPESPNKDQERFIVAAHELGCDESPDAFAATIKKLTKAKPMTNADVRKRRKKK